jgi:hypothetical protein
MRELVFALEFKGRGGAVPDSETLRQARTTAPSQLLSTVLDRAGVQASVAPQAGETAVLESRVERFPDGTFVEDGTITYGAAGSLTFDTIGRGWVGPAPITGRVVGGIVWKITGGSGRFDGASGVITSNFTVNADGEVVDDQFARVYLPTSP